MFSEDLAYASKPLQSQITTLSLQEQKNYYDMLHFSPLKVCDYYFFNFSCIYFLQTLNINLGLILNFISVY